MILIFISLFVVVLSFNFFTVSYQINGVNRVVAGTPIAIFETSINMYNIDETVGPKINKNELESKLTSYYDYCLNDYCHSFSLDYYYYNPKNHSICMANDCQAVEVSVNAVLSFDYLYSRTMYYELGRN